MIASREYVKDLITKLLSKLLYYKNSDNIEDTFKFAITSDGKYGYIKDNKIIPF